MNANKDLVIKAVKVIAEALEKANIPQLEGGIAMRALLDNLAENGLDIRSERNKNKLS